MPAARAGVRGGASAAAREVNATIDGALAAGATEIVCNDSHGTMNNLKPTVLSHTYKPSVISRVTLNGVDCGESEINRLAALEHGCRSR